jgi:glutathione S-transferase
VRERGRFLRVTPYRLYSLPGAGSFAPHLILELLGLPHQTIRVVRDADGGHLEPEGYLELNPSGRIPTLVTPDGRVLSESAAICLALAEEHPAAGLVPPVDAPGRAAFLVRLAYLTNTVQVAILRARYPGRFAASELGREDVRSVAEAELVALRERCAAWYAGRLWAAGSGPRVDDLFLAMLIRWTRLLEEPWWDTPALGELFDRVMALPAATAVLEQEQFEARPPAGT